MTALQNQRNYLIEDLITWKDYEIQMGGYNKIGTGRFSKSITVKTREGSECTSSDNNWTRFDSNLVFLFQFRKLLRRKFVRKRSIRQPSASGGSHRIRSSSTESTRATNCRPGEVTETFKIIFVKKFLQI